MEHQFSSCQIVNKFYTLNRKIVSGSKKKFRKLVSSFSL